MTSRYYLDYVRNMPDSRQKLYKLVAMQGTSQFMQAVSREYARMAARGYRLWRGERHNERE